MIREEERTYYVVFSPLFEQEHWIHKVLKKPFYHVLVLVQTGAYVTMFDPYFKRIDLNCLYADERGLKAEDAGIGWALEGAKIVKFKHMVDEKQTVRHIGNWFPSCVTAVKMLLGFNCLSQTPYGLYKQLIKHGGEDITDKLINTGIAMGFSKPKAPGPSAAELAAQKKQREDLARQEAEAKASSEAKAREESEQLAARRRRQRGRLSLIGSGGELGTRGQTLG